MLLSVHLLNNITEWDKSGVLTDFANETLHHANLTWINQGQSPTCPQNKQQSSFFKPKNLLLLLLLLQYPTKQAVMNKK